MPDHSLSKLIQIRQNSLRAVRLEDDLPKGDLLNSYTLTAQALSTLGRIMDGLGNGARAWTLTGPYGSGKSYFGLFLAHLLDLHRSGHAAAWKMLEQTDPLLGKHIFEQGLGNGQFVTVAATGARAPLQECLARGFEQILQYNAYPPELAKSLQIARQADSRTFLRWLEMFIDTVKSSSLKVRGVLILFDELGKALEYAASRPNDSDIYLLQELAEFAARSGEKIFIFVGILHQAFEQYAIFLDNTTQREWAKVQGRFEDIPFQEPPIQQMRLLAQAFIEPNPATSLLVEDLFFRAENAGWRPITMSADEYATLSKRVFPLHPSVFVALPYFFRRLGQNERSLFAFLSSQESFGFQDFLARHTHENFFRLSNLFDYLAANYQTRLYTSGRARLLTETLERLENTSNLSQTDTDALKTIGLLNWLGEVSSLQATESMILSALHVPGVDDATLKVSLKTLQRRSLIVYRRFNDTYAVWQGSDVDLEERLQAARAALGGTLSISEVLHIYLPPRPLLAHRHSYQTGSQRFFDVRYVDIHNIDEVVLNPSSGASGIVLLCLPGTLAEVEKFGQWARFGMPKNHPDIVTGVAGRAIRLKELAQELRGLHWVRENTPELRDDPVARREWRTRLAAIERVIRLELDEAVNLHKISLLAGCQWFYQGQDVSDQTRRGLSVLLSTICDSLYPASPRIWNELLNRRELTSQGAAARRTLMEGILTRADQPLFGIQKFPPERSMYEALMRQGNMHRADGETWRIFPPADNTLNLHPAWQAIFDFTFNGLPEPHPLADLYALLAAPPFGVTQGVAPVLLAAFYKVYENEMTLYKEGTLLVEPGMAEWEVLLRRPELYSLAGCHVLGIRAAVVERMARGLQVPPQVMPVVRAVIGRLKSLPEHAWRTRKLPQSALNLRRAIDTARSPERFLFVEVPEALGVPLFEQSDLNAAHYDIFFEQLNIALDALIHATPRLLTWARDTWLTACSLPADENGWEYFRQQSIELARRVTNPNLLPLLKRSADGADSQAALESVLALIANRPLRTWNDADAERFEAQAAYLGTLWLKEMGGTAISPLSPELQARSQQIVKDLQVYLQDREQNNIVLRAALQELLERLK